MPVRLDNLKNTPPLPAKPYAPFQNPVIARDMARFQHTIRLFWPYFEMARIQRQIDILDQHALVAHAHLSFADSVLQRDARRVFLDSLPFLVENAEQGDNEAILALLEHNPRRFFELLSQQLVAGASWIVDRGYAEHLNGPSHVVLATHLTGIAFEILLSCLQGRGLYRFDSADELNDYLLKSVLNKLITIHESSHAEKRGGKTDFLHIDALSPAQDEATRSAHEWIPAPNPNILEIMALESEIQAQLKPGERDIVTALFGNPDMTNAEIGNKFGITEGAVRARRKKIREKMNQ